MLRSIFHSSLGLAVSVYVRRLTEKVLGGSFAQVFYRIRQVYILAAPSSRRYILALHIMQFMHIFLGLVNLAGGVGILVLLKTPEIVYENKYVSVLYEYFHFESTDHFVVALIGLVVLLFIFRNIFTLILNSFSTYAMKHIERDFLMKVFNFYLRKQYHERISGGFDEFLQKSISASQGVVNATIATSKGFISNMLNLIIIVAVLFNLNFYIAVILIIVMAIFYKSVYQKSKDRFVRYGQKTYRLGQERIRTLRQGFSGITEVILMGKEKDFLSHLEKGMIKEASIQIRSSLFSQVPPVFLQSFMYVAIFCMAGYVLLYSETVSFSVLLIFAGSTMKLLPMMQEIYNMLNAIASNTYMYEQVIRDLRIADRMPAGIDHQKIGRLKLKNSLQLEHIYFSYKENNRKNEFSIKDLNLVIPAGHTVALFGASGEGKSTIAKLICGIITPDQGRVLLNDQSILEDMAQKRSWQRSIGYVEQKPFFLHGTVAENIAFEIDSRKVNLDKVEEAIKSVKLEALIKELPQGVKTDIGYNAMMISGGQAQRISIARALYRDSTLMILDEATNSLDSVTASQILKSIAGKRRTVILIAHNLETLRQVDRIFVVDDGAIVASGTYNELMESNSLFRKLARPYADMEV